MSVIDELQAIRDKVLTWNLDPEPTGDALSEAYGFAYPIAGADTLRTLSFSSRLWVAYRTYEAARAAFEAEQAKQAKLKQSYAKASQQWQAATEDPDTPSEDWARLDNHKRHLEAYLAVTMEERSAQLTKLREAHQQADATWGRYWQEYQQVIGRRAVLERERTLRGDDRWTFDPTAAEVEAITQRLHYLTEPGVAVDVP